MNIDPDLEAKIVHTADCRCHSCKGKLFSENSLAVRMISEKFFMAQIRDLLKANRWRSYHTHNSRKSDIGFPDLVAVRAERVVWIELKTEKGVASAAQSNWLEALQEAGQEVFLWRPSDWKTIVETLT